MDWSWIKEAVVWICGVTGAIVWVIVAFVLIVNAICWLWRSFLEAAGKALREKERRGLEKRVNAAARARNSVNGVA